MGTLVRIITFLMLNCCCSWAVGQAQVPAEELPQWLTQQIAEYEAQRPESAPIIYRVTYQAKPAFHFFVPCCHRQNPLRDEAGTFICFATRGGDFNQTPATCPNGGRDQCTRVQLAWIHPKEDASAKGDALKMVGRLQWDADDYLRCPNGLTP